MAIARERAVQETAADGTITAVGPAERRVLVVDDSAVIRAAITKMLQPHGFAVSCAGDGMSGLKAFRATDPLLVLTDLIMPEMEGIEMIRCMRQEKPKTKIVAMSGSGKIGATSFLEMATLLGADAALQKPFDSDTLFAVLDSVLGPELPAS